MKCLLLIIGLALSGTACAQVAPSPWQSLDTGLELGTFAASRPSPVGDRKITVLRVDPAAWQFTLLTAAQEGRRARTAQQWATEFKQAAIVNAGMFQMDGLTNVGYLKCGTYINNARFNDDNTFIAFEPTDAKLPRFQIIDRECQNWQQLVTQYNYVTQGIRMVDCYRKNRWSEQPRKWSMVIMGMDKAGRALMVFCRSPYSVHEFVDMLLALDIDLRRAMYLEGGPEASLYLKTQDCAFDGYGSYETGFFESDDNDRAWPIPNVIGISRREN
jgi:hypothetical protein